MAKQANRSEVIEWRKAAEADLFTFAQLVNPNRLYGKLHEEIFAYFAKATNKRKLLLVPRAHQKSHCLAVWCAWMITKNPATTIIYVSATEKLAIKQLYSIQQMLESPEYQVLWPDMINAEKGRREKWAATEFMVDNPLRKEMGVRDSTCMVGSVGSNTTGLHCEILVYDDLVVPENAHTAIGRESVSNAYSQFASVANPGSIIIAVGTPYTQRDIYAEMKEEIEPIYDDKGDWVKEEKIWEVLEYAVEDKGDGSGTYLWPRQQSATTKKWEGFNQAILARIKATYKNQADFHAQYYCDPNDPSSARLAYSKFQYYDSKYVKFFDGDWHFKDEILKLYAACDFAYTDNAKSDYTAIVVIGMDGGGNTYILDLMRYKTTKYAVHYDSMLEMAQKWRLRRIHAESNAGANMIVEAVKDIVRERGGRLVVDAKPAPTATSKAERIAAVLEPKYEMGSVWHALGGLTSQLEDELVLARPAHDDLKDALAQALLVARPPMRTSTRNVIPILTHSRFGGIIR